MVRFLSMVCLLAGICLAHAGEAPAKSTQPSSAGAVTKRVGELEQALQKLKLAKAQSGAATGNNLPQRVNELEQTVKALLEELATLKQQVAEAEKKAAAPSPTALNPGISVIADFTGRHYRGDRTAPGLDFSTKNRFELREAEVGFQSVIDPFGRLDAFVAFGPEGAELEEAYATITNARALGLPRQLLVRVGRLRPYFGKLNLTHPIEIHTADAPLPIINFLGEEGLVGNGVEFNYLLPLRKPFTEVRYGVFSNDNATSFAGGSGRQRLLGVGQVRTFLDLSESNNLDLGLSLAHGSNATGANTRLMNAHVVFRHRPPQRGLYNSLTWWNEVYLSSNNQVVDDGTGTGTFVGTRFRKTGLFSFIEKQLDRRWFAGVQYDRSQFPLADGHEQSLTLYGTMFPSEFSRYRAGVRRKQDLVGRWSNEFFLQATFSIGQHRPHAF